MKRAFQPDHWVVIGFGNPGPRYVHTRHNIGFTVLDHIARKSHIRFAKQGLNLVGRGRLGGSRDRVLLAKPLTFMNESGRAVAALLRTEESLSGYLMVVLDDLDLPLGRIRIRPSGGAGGHRGLLSLIEAIKTEEFPRVRVGIGRPEEGRDPAEYVLEPFGPQEVKVIEEAVGLAVEAIEQIVAGRIETAMNRYNSPG